MEKALKLFVWEGVLAVDTDGIAFALAHDVREARRLICAFDPDVSEDDLYSKPRIFTVPVGYAVWGGRG